MNDDLQLLGEYAACQSELAFETLVNRYVNLVYSAALRQVRDPHLAEEVTQATFIVLARKAGSFRREVVLASWLHRTACFVARDAIKSQLRRAQREQEAYMQSASNESQPALEEAWQQIAPLLDTAIAGLGEKDRSAIVLRFFENQSLSEVGKALGTTEDSARMRVSRALAKLRKFFMKRGVTLGTTTIIASVVSGNTVHAAPAGLAKAISAIAVGKGAATGGASFTFAKGALKAMAWAKAQTAIAIGVGLLVVTGTATVAIQRHPEDDWWKDLDGPKLERLPAALVLRPTHFAGELPPFNASRTTSADITVNGHVTRMIGRNRDFRELIRAAYDSDQHRFGARVVFPGNLAKGGFDYIATVPDAPAKKLQDEIRRQFGITASVQVRETNIFVLKIIDPSLFNEKAVPGSTLQWLNDTVSVSDVAKNLESQLQVPVLDQTGATNRYSLREARLPITQNVETLNNALGTTLGLQLVRDRQPIEMLVVEKSPK